MPFGDWCTLCMMFRGRTHQRSEELRWTVFMKMNSVANAQTESEESVTRIAVKKDMHQSIMSSVALKKGIEEHGQSGE